MSTTPGPTPRYDQPLLRIAIPNKGSLSDLRLRDPARGRLPAAHDSKELSLLDTANGVEFFYLRPRDIALYVGEGTLDVGITGRDLLLDSGAKAEEVRRLGFGRSRFRFAARPGTLDSPGRPGRQAHRHVVRRSGAPSSRGARHRRRGDPPRRCRGDQHPARCGRRDRRRRRDRQHAEGRRPGDRRRRDPRLRGGPDHPRGRRGAGRLRGVQAPSRRRARRPHLRDDGLRHADRPGRGGGGAHARPGEPDDLAAASGGLGAPCARWSRGTAPSG